MSRFAPARSASPRRALLASALLALAGLPALSAADWYVSPAGSDSAAGTLADPFQTIQRAANAAAAGDTVHIRAGVYRESITPPASGSAGSPIVFKPYNGESVTISGTEVLSGWTAESDGSYSTALAANYFTSAYNQTLQVFVDGRMINLARWPNTSLDVSRPVKSTITAFVSKTRDTTTNWTTAVFEDNALSPQTDGYYVGAEVYVQPDKDRWSWTLTGTVIAQTGKRLTIRSRNDCGTDGDSTRYEIGSNYFLFNQRQMLDADGEWFHDTAAGRLYLRTPDGSNPAGKTIEAKKRELAFNLNGRSHITIEGLKLFACTITTDTASGGDNIGFTSTGANRYPWRQNNSLASSSFVTLDGLEVRYPSHYTDLSGHFYYQWGQSTGLVVSGSDHIVRNCLVQYSAGNGITIMGRRVQATNNVIKDVNYLSTDCAGITTGGGTAMSVDHEIAYNTIRYAARSGMTIRGFANSDATVLRARVHHNDIGHCSLQDADAAGIYTASQNGKFLRIDHNRIHNIRGYIGSGVYLDYSRDYIVDHNVVWNAERPINLQGHLDGVNNHLVYNNTLHVWIDTDPTWPRMAFAGDTGWQDGTVIRNNVYFLAGASTGYRPFGSAYNRDERSDNLEWDYVAGSATDPKFADWQGGDFALLTGSPARDSGAVIPSYTRSNVSVPAFSDATDGLPDKGAFEAGLTPWAAGVIGGVAVFGNNVVIADGDASPSAADHTDFGVVNTGAHLTRTFTIANVGTRTINLTGSPLVQVSGANAGDFTITAPTVTTLAPSASTTFQIRFAPSAVFKRSATVTIFTDDCVNDRYTFSLRGEGGGLVAYEGFDLTTGSLDGRSGSTSLGWTGNWTLGAGTAPTIVAASLVNGRLATVGNHVEQAVTTTSTDISRSFSATLGADVAYNAPRTLWLSFQAKRLSGSGNDCALVLVRDAGGDIIRIGRISGTTNWSLQTASNATGSDTNADLAWDSGSTTEKLAVVKLELSRTLTTGSGVNLYKAWLWLLDEPPATEPSTSTAAASVTTNTLTTGTGLAKLKLVNSTGKSVAAFDEIRLGTSYASAVPRANPELFAYEGFDVSAGALAGQSGASSFGWTGNWTLASGTSPTIVEGSLDIAGLATSGNQVNQSASAADIGRSLSQTLGSDLTGSATRVFWVSFAAKRLSGTGYDCSLDLMRDNGGVALRLGRLTGTTNWSLSAANNAAGSDTNADHAWDTGSTTPQFALMRVELSRSGSGTGANIYKAWAWVGASLPATEPALSTAQAAVTSTTFSLGTGINKVRLFNSAAKSVAAFDEIRLGNTFDSVAK